MWCISMQLENKHFPQERYMFYSKREALRRYKEKHSLKYKRDLVICCYKA